MAVTWRLHGGYIRLPRERSAVAQPAFLQRSERRRERGAKPSVVCEYMAVTHGGYITFAQRWRARESRKATRDLRRGGYIAVTLRLRCGNIAVTLRLHGGYMAVTRVINTAVASAGASVVHSHAWSARQLHTAVRPGG